MVTKEVVVVPHTHWDREWYRTFQAFRLRLIDAVDRVVELLEAGKIPHFLLDGQTVMLEDYLTIRPEMRDRLKRLVESGKLSIGPWYILPDEFLVSGESLIRNLQFGRRLTAEFGGRSDVGYLPDMFGHVAQIPQLLLGFGMERAIIWRGIDPDGELFWWRAPSGARIATTFLPTGYCNIFLWEKLPLETRLETFEKFLAEHKHDKILLLSGCDHLAPNSDLPEIVSAIQEKWPEGTIRLGRVSDSFNGMPAAGHEVTGELRAGGRLSYGGMAYLLPGVLSARMYLKQLNADCQTLWERYVEPLTGLVAALGGSFPEGYHREGWRKILLNQPHDSICGCSVDEVHREMLGRFSEAKELGESLVARALHQLSPAGAEPGVIVYNPLGWDRSDWVKAVVEWPLEGAPEEIHLVDERGRKVAGILESVEDTEAFYSEVDLFPGWRPVRRFHFTLLVEDVPAMGVKRLTAKPGTMDVLDQGTATGPNSISNEHMRLFVKDGALYLEDLDTGALYADVHSFEDGADAGDEYNYSPPEHDQIVTSQLEHWVVERSTAAEAVLRVVYRLELPESLSADRHGRSRRKVSVIVLSRFTLKAGSRTVEVETELDNRVRDHRLRVRFGTGLKEGVRAWSENQFWVAERPLDHAAPQLPVGKLEEYTDATFPQQTWSAVEGDYGLLVANQGLPEAEVSKAPDGNWGLVVTLLRCVGWLSRDDLRTRGGGAGPHFETPDAQCQGPQRFRYALLPYRDHWSIAQPAAHGFVAPLKSLGFGGDQASLSGGRTLGNWLTVGDHRLVVSAVKRAEGQDGLVVRLYNPTEREIETELTVGLPHRAIAIANLAEETQREVGAQRVTLLVGSGEITTLLIKP